MAGDTPQRTSRRALLAGGARVALAGAAAATAAAARAEPGSPTDTSRAPGGPMRALSERSPFARIKRTLLDGPHEGISYTPIAELDGTLTPNDLHFTRHHAGIPAIDPATWSLTVHGLVERPLVFTLDDLKRLPSVSRVAFIECSGNGIAAARGRHRELTPTVIDGALSCAQWTGTPLATLLREVGVQPQARWFIAQSQDGCQYARSIPIAKAWDDALVAWAQNGEPVRREQGYPVRLLLPGYEGAAQVKWLRRIELVEEPVFFREETARYSDLRPDGRIEVLNLIHAVKSTLTSPTFPAHLTPGFVELRGLAWSGRGRVAHVDVSTDGGATWHRARLEEPVLPKALTRFTFPWRFDGAPATLLSRATDETGDTQLTHTALARTRTAGHDYHNNAIRGWHVAASGAVTFEQT